MPMVFHGGATDCPVALTPPKGEIPRQKFLKEAISTGTWTHPSKKWTKEVTTILLDSWVNTFNKMKSNGIKVPFVKDHTVKADTTLGYIDSIFRQGERLLFTTVVKGKENIEKVQIVDDVSICVEDFIDGKGNKYGEAITHIGLTPEPVVSGQSKVIPIAASQGESKQELLVFSRVPVNKEVKMLKPEDLKKLQEAMGVEAELTEDNLVTTVVEKFSKSDSQLALLKEELEKANAKIEEFSKSSSASLDNATLEDRAEEIEDRIDRIGKERGLVPAVCASLKSALCGKTDARNAVMLSRSEIANDKGRKPIRAHVILDAIEQIQIVKTREQTGSQAFSFSGNDDDKKFQEELEQRAKRAFGK